MENNFFGDVKTPQIVTVFKDYNLYKDGLKENAWGRIYDLITSQIVLPVKIYQEWMLEDDESRMIKYIEGVETGKHNPIAVVALNVNSIHDMKTYNLQDAISLYTELAKVEPFNFKDIVRFSKVYGLPYGINDNKGSGGIIVYSDKLKVIGDNYIQLNSELVLYRYIFDLFQSVVTQDLDNLRKMQKEKFDERLKRVEEYKKNVEKNGTNHLIWDEIDKVISMDQKDYDDSLVLISGKRDLEAFLKQRGGVNIDLGMDEQQGVFHPTAYFSNLFKYSYFQIMQALVNNVELRKCEYCGHVFEVTYEGRRFCPPLPFRKRSSCEMAYNNRRRNHDNEGTD